MSAGVRVPPTTVALSTASVFPESTAAAFELSSRLGYDAVELMVWTDPVSQSADAVKALSDLHEIPVCSVHAPCLLVTQRVWSADPWVRLRRSVEMAQALRASTVVVHPPFRWQRDYARDFVTGVRRLSEDSGVVVAVENMFPWRAGGRELAAYAPGWDVCAEDYDACTLDLSHTAVSGSDALAMADAMGGRLAHVHLADGTGSPRDEHLVPGRGRQPCAGLLERLAVAGWDRIVVLEVTTRGVRERGQREGDLAEALAFTRLNLASALDTVYAISPDGSAEPVLRGAAK